MLTGQWVGLRPIEPADLEALRRWRNTPSHMQFFRQVDEISPEQQQQWYRHMLADPSVEMFSIVALDNQRLLGACGLTYISLPHKKAEISLYIGEGYVDDRYAPDATRVLLDYGFGELSLHRLWAEIFANDERKQELFESLGFSQEGRLRASYLKKGQWFDSLVYSILK